MSPNFVLKQMTCLLTLLWQTDARAKEIEGLKRIETGYRFSQCFPDCA